MVDLGLSCLVEQERCVWADLGRRRRELQHRGNGRKNRQRLRLVKTRAVGRDAYVTSGLHANYKEYKGQKAPYSFEYDTRSQAIRTYSLPLP